MIVTTRRCIVVMMLMLGGCVCGPAQWAVELGHQLKCGMVPQEVERVVGQPVRPLNRSWATHYIGEETDATIVWLTFEEDKLQASQLGWMYALKRMARADQIWLCSIPRSSSGAGSSNRA